MQIKLLQNLVEELAGVDTGRIVDILFNKKDVNEFLIAKKMELTINQVRNILYKLSDYGFVSSIRKKDKRKGWYTYFWKIESIKALDFLKKNIEKRIAQINNQIESRSTKTFYICENCNIEFNEENALLYDFTCSECGGIFIIKDNMKLLRELKKNFDKQRRELSLVEEEIKKEMDSLEKRKIREMKKDKKKAIKKKIIKKKTTKKKPLKKSKLVKKKIPLKKKKIKKKVKKKLVKKKIIKKKTTKKKPLKKSKLVKRIKKLKLKPKKGKKSKKNKKK